jgi:two-component system nitrate/nitrite response regulator NarL
LSPIRIIVADDHPVVRRGVVSLLALDDRFIVVADCANGREAIAAIRTHRPDIALLDISMPELTGLQVQDLTNAEKLATRIVFLAASPDDRELLAAAVGGAFAIVLKDAASDALLECLHEVAAGRRCLPNALLAAALSRNHERDAHENLVGKILTEREREVMFLVADGLTNKDIARRLRVTEGTIKIHLHNIYRKAAVSNRTALAALAHLHKERRTR